jgi:transcriptional regulator with XRE-family HTH domain
VSDGGQARAARRELGQQLKRLREAAGLSQQQVARRAGYTRSAVSNAESGGHARRRFWERCDEIFGTATVLAGGYDQIHARPAPPAPDGPERDGGAAGLELLHAAQDSGSLNEALAGYRKLGWPVEQHGRELALVTGTVIDALEVPRPAGILAARWWLLTGGAADLVRALPALPRPGPGLAVIDAGGSMFFLASSDDQARPFTGQALAVVPGPGGAPPVQNTGVVCWHGPGSHIPAPPSAAGHGPAAAWAYLPSARLRLAPAIGLLDLLARAVATAGPGAGRLTFPSGVIVLPARQPCR